MIMSDEVSTQEVLETTAQDTDTVETTSPDVDPLGDLNTPIEDEEQEQSSEGENEENPEIDWEDRAKKAEEAVRRTEGNAKKLQRLESKVKPSILERLSEISQEDQEEFLQSIVSGRRQEQKPQENGENQSYVDWEDKEQVIEKLSANPAETMWASADVVVKHYAPQIIDLAVEKAVKQVEERFSGVQNQFNDNQVDRAYREVEKYAEKNGVVLKINDKSNKAFQGMMDILAKNPEGYDKSHNPMKDLFVDFYMDYTSKSKSDTRKKARMEAASSPRHEPEGTDIDAPKGKNMGELVEDAKAIALRQYGRGEANILDDS